MNDAMRLYVSEVKGQPSRPFVKKKVTFQTDSAEEMVDSGVAMGDSDLVTWLEEIQLDQTSIQRVSNRANPLWYELTGFTIVCLHVQFVAEQLTLSDVLDHMTRDDVIDLKLK